MLDLATDTVLHNTEVLELIMDRLPIPCALSFASCGRLFWRVWKEKQNTELRIAQHRLDDDAVIVVVEALQDVIRRPVQAMLFDMPFPNSGISFASRFTVEPTPLSIEESLLGRKSIRVTAFFKTLDGQEDVSIHVVPNFRNREAGWYQPSRRSEKPTIDGFIPYNSLADVFVAYRGHVDPDEDVEADRMRFFNAVYGTVDDYEPADGDF